MSDNYNENRMKIDITGVDLVKFVKKAYELSVPRGLGFLSMQDGPLSDEDAADCIYDSGSCVVAMDYVHGRGCKMNVFRTSDGRLTINAPWYDHTDEQLQELLAHCGITDFSVSGEHNQSCECPECNRRRAHA